MNTIIQTTALAFAFLFSLDSATAQDIRMRTEQVGRVELDVPDSLVWSDEGSALVGRWTEMDEVLLHITEYTPLRDGKPVAGAGPKIVVAQAKDRGIKLEREGASVWSYEYHGGAPDAELHMWTVGYDAHTVMISCVIDAKDVDSDKSGALLEMMAITIRSVRGLGAGP